MTKHRRKKNEEKKRERKETCLLLGFKTLNIKSSDQIFPPPINIITYKLRSRERALLFSPPPLSSLFDFSFFVVFCRQRDDVNDVGGTTFLKREVVGWSLLSSVKKKEREFRARFVD